MEESSGTAFIIALAIITIFGALTFEKYIDKRNELEFVKAGLVQKIENGEKVWTKP